MKFLDFLKEAFSVLKKNPKLFTPKLLVAAVYGVSLVLAALITKQFFPLLMEIQEQGLSTETAAIINQATPFLFFAIFWSFFSLLLDIFVNAMYPSLVSDFKSNKPISLIKAVKKAKNRSLVVIPAALIITFCVFTPLVFLTEYSFLLKNYLLSIIAGFALLIAMLLFIALFYFVYPVLVLERVSVFNGLKKSLSLSKKNTSIALKASVFPFIVSLFNFYLAFDIFNPVNFALFVFSRFLVAVLATYHVVLNPLLYLGVKK